MDMKGIKRAINVDFWNLQYIFHMYSSETFYLFSSVCPTSGVSWVSSRTVTQGTQRKEEEKRKRSFRLWPTICSVVGVLRLSTFVFFGVVLEEERSMSWPFPPRRIVLPFENLLLKGWRRFVVSFFNTEDGNGPIFFRGGGGDDPTILSSDLFFSPEIRNNPSFVR